MAKARILQGGRSGVSGSNKHVRGGGQRQSVHKVERLGGLDRRSVGERVRVEDVHLAVAQALEERGGDCLSGGFRIRGNGVGKVAQLVVVDDPALARAVGKEEQVWRWETAGGSG